jgi:hypothetical protein
LVTRAQSMNTVLDDNKKLCLNSGETINLTPQMTMMFEVEDLTAASPATVSRCGMIYLASDQLGWQSLVHSWCNALSPPVHEYRNFVKGLFAWLVPPSLALVQRKLSMPVPLTSMHLVASMLRLMSAAIAQCFPSESRGSSDGGIVLQRPASTAAGRPRRKSAAGAGAAAAAGGVGGASSGASSGAADGADSGAPAPVAEPPASRHTAQAAAKRAHDRVMQIRLEAITVFSLVWSIGASVDGNGRAVFDQMLRRLLSAAALADLDCLPKSASVLLNELMGGGDSYSDLMSPSMKSPTYSAGSAEDGGGRRMVVPIPEKGQTVFDFALEVDGVVVGAMTGEPSPSSATPGIAVAPAAARPVFSPQPADSSGTAGLLPQSPTGGVKWIDWIPQVALATYSIPANTPYDAIVVPTVDTVRYCRIMTALALNGSHVLCVGPTGTAKTIVMTQWLLPALNDAASTVALAMDLPSVRQSTPATTAGRKASTRTGGTDALVDKRKKFTSLLLQFTAHTSAATVQLTIEESVSKRRVNVYGPAHGRKQVIMIDDVSMPSPDEYGCQPVIELLRQWMDYGGWYATSDKMKAFRRLVDVQMVAAMGVAGAGRPVVTSRFLRHFSALSFVVYDNTSLTHIFTSILKWYLDSSVGEVRHGDGGGVVSACCCCCCRFCCGSGVGSWMLTYCWPARAAGASGGLAGGVCVCGSVQRRSIAPATHASEEPLHVQSA